MVISHTGRVADDFYVLGHAAQPIYLLDGPAPALFDSGYTAMALVFEEAVRTALAGRTPSYLFLTHSHFDHIGSAAHLKRVWPEMQIVSSAGVKRVLERPTAVAVIRDLNAAAAPRVRAMLADGKVNEAPFEPFAVDRVVGEGEEVQLTADLRVGALESPGHTRDMTSYWIPEKRILVASEAIGIEEAEGDITTDFLVGYDVFWNSLLRLSQIDADVLCQGHGLVFTGEDAKTRLARAKESTARFARRLEHLLAEEGGDLERVAARVKAAEYDRKTGDMKLPEPAYLLNLGAKIKAIWARMQSPTRTR